MLPVIQGVVDLLQAGPNATFINLDGEESQVGPLTVAFTHDNQINQMVSRLGIFDRQPPLQPDAMNSSRIYVSSRNNPMRGTVAFERLNCPARPTKLWLRLKLNDAVYRTLPLSPVPSHPCPETKLTLLTR